jgi:tetratricopeptide (TPR) repeat protein
MTPADELRELLTVNEKRTANLRGSGTGTLDLLRDLDRIAELWPKLEALGVDLRAEEGRWETLRAGVRRQAAEIVAEMRAVGGIAAARAAEHGPEPVIWWWLLDERTRADRVRQWRSALLLISGAAALITVGVLLFRLLFPVDPALRAALSRQSAGESKIERGDYAAALAEFAEITRLRPDDPEGWLWLGAAYEALGRSAEAAAAFAQGRTLLGNEISFRQARVPIYFTFQAYDRAQADLEAALREDPENPYTYYFYAGLYETQGRLQEAAVALERASQFAEAHGQAQITAMARYRLAMVLQQLQAQSIQRPSPTP